ncbi:hypothetical protein [Sorangium sp. So ce117]|uniref:hypothetical protein n=1 Tax=Sorangium sp. So ce117 TaxID=3133277 RepID=UPI003F5E9CC7
MAISRELHHHQIGYARAAYDRFRIAESSIAIDGLWEHDLTFFIVSRDVPRLSPDEWHAIHKTIAEVAHATLDIRVVSAPPEGAVPVSPRTTEEVIEGVGDTGTMADLFHDLALALPPEFPDIRLTNGEAGLFVITAMRPLSSDERQVLLCAFEKVRPGADFCVRVGELSAPVRSTTFTLVSSKGLPAGFSKEARWAIERDEQFWLERRHEVFTSDTISHKDILPKSFALGTSCLVDAVWPRNVRTYLPIFRRVVLLAPPENLQDQWLGNLAITKSEFLELVSLGRVQVVFHGEYSTYDSTLLAALAEQSPNGILLSRSLAAATIVDHRARTGLTSTLDVAQRAAFLAALRKQAQQIADPLERKFFDAVLADRQRASFAEVTWNRCGANAALYFGPGRLAADIVAAHGRDLLIELTSAGLSVAFGGALSAVVFPAEGPGYSAQTATELCASLYTGTRAGPVDTKLGEVEPVVEDLLGLDNDAPVIDLARAFAGDDIDRLRDVAFGIAGANLDADFRRAATAELLDRVRRYDAKDQHQSRFDVLRALGALGGLGSVAAAAAGAPAVGMALGFLPFAVWVLKSAFASDSAGKFRDQVLALNAFSRTDAVLVSRMRARTANK